VFCRVTKNPHPGCYRFFDECEASVPTLFPRRTNSTRAFFFLFKPQQNSRTQQALRRKGQHKQALLKPDHYVLQIKGRIYSRSIQSRKKVLSNQTKFSSFKVNA